MRYEDQFWVAKAVPVKITDTLLIILAVCIVGAGGLVWFNRDSDKILTAVFPAGIVAVVGVLLGVLVFGQQAPIDVTFPAYFQYDSATRMPWMPQWGIGSRWVADSYMVCLQLQKMNPDAFKNLADPKGLQLYHQLLQWSLFRWLSQAYGGHWKAEILHFDLPDSREGSYKSSWPGAGLAIRIPHEEIKTKLGTNPFASVNMPIQIGIAVPPGTTLQVAVPTAPEASEGEGQITLTNRLFTLTIHTRTAGSKDSVGQYARLAGLSQDDDAKLFTAIYHLKVHVEFSRWFSGDPRMREYRAWMEQLVSELRDSFDEQAIWKQLTKEYLLRRQIEHYGPFK